MTRHDEIPLLPIVKKTGEVPEVPPFTDKVVDNFVVARRHPCEPKVQKTIEISQLHITDKVSDVLLC